MQCRASKKHRHVRLAAPLRVGSLLPNSSAPHVHMNTIVLIVLPSVSLVTNVRRNGRITFRST